MSKSVFHANPLRWMCEGNCHFESQLHAFTIYRHEPKEVGGGERVRTDDLLLAKQVLSQLSYAPEKMVGLGRLELPTSRLSGVRSNQAELQARTVQKPPSKMLWHL